jgi:hypothetical protein
MKNKKLLYIGLGVVALVGLYFIFKPKGDSTPVDPNLGKSNPPSGGDMGGSTSGGDMGGSGMGSETPPLTPIASGSSDLGRGKNRRNCRRDAREIYGRVPLRKKDRDDKQKFVADCIKNGGIDDGSGD